jgi:Flp pilus assembly protein TadD
MTRTISTPMGRMARPVLIVLALAALACGGDKPKPTVTTTEAHGSTPAPAVATPVVVSTPAPAFVSAEGAYKAGDFKVAAEMYKTVVDSTPDDAFGQYMLGLSSWKAGDFKGAKEAFDKSIELDSTFAKAYFNEARVLLDLKRAPEALEMIAKGRAIDSTSPDGLRLTARAKIASGDIDGGMATYRELLTGNETDVWGLSNYGMLLLESGQFEDALASARVAGVPEQPWHGARKGGASGGGAAPVPAGGGERFHVREGGEERRAASDDRDRQLGDRRGGRGRDRRAVPAAGAGVEDAGRGAEAVGSDPP